MSKAYDEGFREGRSVAEGFMKDTMNQRERRIRALSPFMKTVQPVKYADWKRGFQAGYEDYFKSRPCIAPVGINI